MEVIPNPSVPFLGKIPGNLQVGRMITVAGHVTYGTQRFRIDLLRGKHIDASEIALHFNPRFTECAVVRNSFSNGEWKHEERHGPPFPFTIGQDFEVIFLVKDTHFKIAINGRHYTEFAHRMQFNSIDKINVRGKIMLHKVQFAWEKPCNVAAYPPYPTACSPFSKPQPQQHFVAPTACHPAFAPVSNPAIPFKYSIYGGIYENMNIYITGQSCIGESRFEINLICGSDCDPLSDTALHFNPRFDEGDVVCNSFINEFWGPEERSAFPFPFRQGERFNVVIRVQSDKYVININGQKFIEYRHRIMPLSRIDTLDIKGNVAIHAIRFD